jgi:ABC-2 type transport system permease protein
MFPILKAEFRKLLTVRSTYILTIVALILISIFAGFFEGYKGNTGSPASKLQPTAYVEIVNNSIGMTIIFVAIIAILFVTHEYRYNTIMYTLTANVRRTKVLLGKLLASVSLGLAFGVVASLFAVAVYRVGLAFRGAVLPSQDIDVLSLLGQVLFYCVSYVLIAVLIAVATRSVVAGIATFLIAPVTIEPLLSLVLKENAKYLPFTALDSTMGVSVSSNTLSTGVAMAVSAIYVLVGLAITWFLFVRRDAN